MFYNIINFNLIFSFFLDQTPIGCKTMSSITSWTDSHVSNNLLNMTSLSDISEVLTSDTNSANPKELTKALLSGGISIYYNQMLT